MRFLNLFILVVFLSISTLAHSAPVDQDPVVRKIYEVYQNAHSPTIEELSLNEPWKCQFFWAGRDQQIEKRFLVSFHMMNGYLVAALDGDFGFTVVGGELASSTNFFGSYYGELISYMAVNKKNADVNNYWALRTTGRGNLLMEAFFTLEDLGPMKTLQSQWSHIYLPSATFPNQGFAYGYGNCIPK